MVLSTCANCGSMSVYPSDLLDTAPICPHCGRTVAILAPIYTEAEMRDYFPELSAEVEAISAKNNNPTHHLGLPATPSRELLLAYESQSLLLPFEHH
jgi:hypothetical protein